MTHDRDTYFFFFFFGTYGTNLICVNFYFFEKSIRAVFEMKNEIVNFDFFPRGEGL